MASEVQIANRALHKLGVRKRITSLSLDGTKQSKLINGMFADVRDAEFEDHYWRFAMRQFSVAALSTTPAHTWDAEYQLPVDFAKLYRLVDNPKFAPQGKKILTDAGAPLQGEYIAIITDPNEWSPLFREGLAARIAFECTETLTQSNTKKEAMAADYKDTIRRAKRSNAIMLDPEQEEITAWEEVRF